MPLPSLKTSHLFPILLRIKAIACVIAHKALWYQPLTPFTSSGQISATLSFTHSAWAAPRFRSLYWLFLPPGTPFPKYSHGNSQPSFRSLHKCHLVNEPFSDLPYLKCYSQSPPSLHSIPILLILMTCSCIIYLFIIPILLSLSTRMEAP